MQQLPTLRDLYEQTYTYRRFFLQFGVVEDVEDPSHLGHDGTKTQREAKGGKPGSDLQNEINEIYNAYKISDVEQIRNYPLNQPILSKHLAGY